LTQQHSGLLPAAQILVIDDDPNIRALLVEVLKASGHHIVEAANGQEAMQIATVLDFDLVITDLVMPDVEGLELIQWLRKVRPEARIIAISGASNGDCYLSTARIFGATAAIPKPFQIDVFLATVRDVLSLKRNHSEPDNRENRG
jgi:DNA-binding NtrC family response regulator